MIQNLPFEGLGVVEECTLITFMDSDLVKKKNQSEREDFKILRQIQPRWAANYDISIWSMCHLLLFEVTNSLNGLFAFDRRGGVTRFQLDDGLGSLVQPGHNGLEFIQLFSLLLSW